MKGEDIRVVDLGNIDKGISLGKFYYSENPLTNEKIPIFTTTYILGDYGEGAVMGVPAHDDRDKAFAVKNRLKSIKVINEESETLINSSEFNGLKIEQA